MSDPITNAFSYDALPDHGFRILELFPGSPTDPLRGTIHIRDREPSVYYYECISYTWGSSDLTQAIELDGAMLPITTNLHDCLTDFRLPPGESQPLWKGFPFKVAGLQRRPLDYPTTGSRFLWVDSVCINQKNDKEKAAQVARMVTYYTEARHVLVHLSRQHTGGKLLLDLVDDFKQHSRTTLLRKSKNRAVVWLKKNLLNTRYDAAAWDQLRNMVAAPYWRRCWIVAELLKASRIYIYCTSACVTFEDFATAIEWADDLGENYRYVTDLDALSLQFEAIHEVKYRRGKDKSETQGSAYQTLIQFLIAFRSHNASNPRDHIYSLLGLAEEAQSLGQRTDSFFDLNPTRPVDPSHELVRLKIIDYEESISDCYTRFASYMIKGYSGYVQTLLLHLSSCGTREDLPSWVPDWSTSGTQAHLCNPSAVDTLGNDWEAALWCESHMRLMGNGALKIRGRFLDKVIRIGQTDAEATQDPRLLEVRPVILAPALWIAKRMFGEFQHYLEGTSSYQGSTDMDEAIIKVVLAGGNDRASSLSSLIPHIMACCEMEAHWIKEALLSDTLTGTELETCIVSKRAESPKFWKHYVKITRHFAQIREHLVFRRSGLTEKLSIGLLPGRAAVGDMIFLPFGSRTPFVVRQARGDAWALIGDCYVGGMMHGEVGGEHSSEDVTFV